MGDIMTSLIQNSFSKLSLMEKRGLLRRGGRSLAITSHSLDTMSNSNFRFFMLCDHDQLMNTFHFILLPLRRVALQPELICKGPST